MRKDTFTFSISPDTSDQRPFENWEHRPIDGQPPGEFIDRETWRAIKKTESWRGLSSEILRVRSLVRSFGECISPNTFYQPLHECCCELGDLRSKRVT